MKRATLLFSVVFVAAVVIFINIVFSENEGRSAKLTLVKGNIMVQAKGETEWQKAGENTIVKEGDTIKTASQSSAILKLDDGTMIKVGPLAKMTVSILAQVSGNNRTDFDISMGKTWARVKKLTGESTFDVKTPTAVAGVRGTYFSSEVQGEANSIFDVFEGEVTVKSRTDSSQTVAVKANQSTSVSANKPPAAPVAIPSQKANELKNGFSNEEVNAASYEIQVNAEPAELSPGEKAKVNIQVFKNGKTVQDSLNLKVSLGGSATFTANGAQEMEVKTDNNGKSSLEITDTTVESVSVDVKMQVKTTK